MERNKEKISLNDSDHTFSIAIIVNNETNTNPSDNATAFNSLFPKGAIDIQ